MEKATLIGIVAGVLLIFGTILLGDGAMTYLDVPSIVIVLGGTVSGLLITFSMDDVKSVGRGCKEFFTYQAPDLRARVGEFTELSKLARREGLLALDRQLGQITDPMLKFGLEMAVDGTAEEDVDSLLRTRIAESIAHRRFMTKFFNAAGTYAPAFGMIGTLIGLIQMLQNLSEPSAIGPAMAVAMITTFYGAFLANLLFLPMAAKIKDQMGLQLKELELVRTGILGIVRGDSPTAIEKRLLLYCGPDGAPAPAADAPAKKAA